MIRAANFALLARTLTALIMSTFLRAAIRFLQIKVIGITDHTSCVVQVTGGAVSGMQIVDIDTSVTRN